MQARIRATEIRRIPGHSMLIQASRVEDTVVSVSLKLLPRPITARSVGCDWYLSSLRRS